MFFPGWLNVERPNVLFLSHKFSILALLLSAVWAIGFVLGRKSVRCPEIHKESTKIQIAEDKQQVKREYITKYVYKAGEKVSEERRVVQTETKKVKDTEVFVKKEPSQQHDWDVSFLVDTSKSYKQIDAYEIQIGRRIFGDLFLVAGTNLDLETKLGLKLEL